MESHIVKSNIKVCVKTPEFHKKRRKSKKNKQEMINDSLTLTDRQRWNKEIFFLIIKTFHHKNEEIMTIQYE